MSIRRFHRMADAEAIRRVRAGIPPHSEPQPVKRKKPHRPAWTHRGYWRNAQRANRWA